MADPNAAGGCTPPPPKPADGSSDWKDAVHPNCFSNIARLAVWTGGEAVLQHGQPPGNYFIPLAPGSVGRGPQAASVHLYVVIHGWARGYRDAVRKAGGKLRWWEDGAASGGVWPSDWAWVGVSGTNPAIPVNQTGMLQSIVAYDPSAIAMVYSWIDDSATPGGTAKLEDVYTSEAYTTINGLRLANALQEAVSPAFWTNRSNSVHLIGHSHGSKVATVAALSLQAKGLRADVLTILDAPESDIPRDANGANFLALFLAQLAIANPTKQGSPGAFVDNYASCFGVAYRGPSDLGKVVGVMLDPSEIYSSDDLPSQHTYAAAWYGGAAVGAVQNRLEPLGLGWPPPWIPFAPALDQSWPGGARPAGQWPLKVGQPLHAAYKYSFPGLAVTDEGRKGNVSGDPGSGLVFGAPGPQQAYSKFIGGYANSPFSDAYGIAFDVSWSAPQDGDYLVVTAQSPDLREQEVLLVMDGRSAPRGGPAAMNADVSGPDLWFYVFYFPAVGNTQGKVTLSNFRSVVVESG